ncbi:hypothetical protein [Qipengyuania seohaensis]|uniref:hypothetical protein n=1 Tax=Qipengyuania seohaensis TaxID=266951 RepID=UPI0012FE5CD1|nr:hypothetical protein [Qipengyuania seohaensis]
MKRIAIIAVGALLMAGCQDEPGEVAADDGMQTAEGEVLGGTISDDMLPLATQTSQAPPLRQKSDDEPTAASSDGDAAETQDDSAEEPSAAEPAEPADEAEGADAEGEA